MKAERIYYIDWLRVLAIFTMILFHCARFFDAWGWHVKNKESAFVMSSFVSFLGQWLMPLFFVLSGLSSYFALSHQRGIQHINARVKRLLIPFIFGTFALIPPQVYLERISNSQFSGSFIQFYPHYFDGFYGFGGNFAWMGLHLWYLLFLFVFSLITLPLFLYLRKESSFQLISRLAAFFNKPGAIFLFAIPLIIVYLLVKLQPEGIGREDFGGWSIFIYPLFFIYGYLLATNSQFRLALERGRIPSLVIGVIISTIIILDMRFSQYVDYLGNVPQYILDGIVRPLNSWCWVVAILGVGGKHLGFNNRFLKYANEAVLPVYMLHQTVIL